MQVIDNSRLKKFTLPGIVHQTLAGARDGLKTLEIWRQTMAPGAATPRHRHDCEEVFVILAGSGRLSIEDRDFDFGPDTTLIVPPDAVHQVVNTGTAELSFVVVLGMAPVAATTPEGETISLPWRSG